jgi:hypothetical protein
MEAKGFLLENMCQSVRFGKISILVFTLIKKIAAKKYLPMPGLLGCTASQGRMN